MANVCSFLMKIKGNRDDMVDFYMALNQKGKIWMGRGANTDFASDGETALMSGTCKWSVLSALVDCAVSMRNEPDKWYHDPDSGGIEYITLWEACRRWNITMEVYSEECGCQFQEHFRCDKGDIIYTECVGWEEYDIYDYETKEEAEEDLEVKFTDEEWANAEDYRITRGGFENWTFEI